MSEGGGGAQATAGGQLVALALCLHAVPSTSEEGLGVTGQGAWAAQAGGPHECGTPSSLRQGVSSRVARWLGQS